MAKVFILALLIISGCASGPIGHLPILENEQQAGQIFVIRNKNIVGSAMSYYIYVDDNEIFAIRTGQYTKFKLISGEHYIGVGCGSVGDIKKITLLPQTELYFVVSPNFSCADIQQISPEEGQKQINKSKYVSMEQ